jgi:predicted kinase
LGDCVASYHAGLPPVVEWDSAGVQASIARGNAGAALAAGLPRLEIERWTASCLNAIDSLRPWLTGRVASGFVRRCHGDLHLGNLCLWDGKPTPFDALEFDEALATIDTAYDLAFLLMDLDCRVGRAAANRVMNRYVARTGDVALVKGLPLFLSQRAMVRAHVLASMGQPDAARDRLKAALAYLSPAPGQVVAIGGLQGTGKSSLARALAPGLGPAPGALILRSDELRKRLFGYVPEQRLPAEAYSADWNKVANAALVDQVRQAAATGHAVIADSTFLEPRMARDLAATGVGFTGIWLQAPMAELERRVAGRRGDASDATVAVLRRSAERNIAPAGWTEVDATDAGAALATVRGLLMLPA